MSCLGFERRKLFPLTPVDAYKRRQFLEDRISTDDISQKDFISNHPFSSAWQGELINFTFPGTFFPLPHLGLSPLLFAESQTLPTFIHCVIGGASEGTSREKAVERKLKRLCNEAETMVTKEIIFSSLRGMLTSKAIKFENFMTLQGLQPQKQALVWCFNKLQASETSTSDMLTLPSWNATQLCCSLIFVFGRVI